MMRITTHNMTLLSDEEEERGAVHLSHAQRIRSRRGAFQCLPVYCSTDVSHGSWWFVWGSLVAMFTAVVPLLQEHIHFFQTNDDTLPVLDFYSTWALLIVSGFFFTVGSYAFVRAFEEPPQKPLFTWRHVETDELLGAWLFFFGTAPAVPYAAIFYFLHPSEVIYLGAMIVAGLFVVGSLLFVFACYPSDKKHRQIIKPVVRVCFGSHHWIVKHLQNDWLAGTWFFFYASLICLLGSIVVLCFSLSYGNDEEIFIYSSSVLDCFIFTVGSAYFVAGSYPLDHYKCYKAKRYSDVQQRQLQPIPHSEIDMQTGSIDDEM